MHWAPVPYSGNATVTVCNEQTKTVDLAGTTTIMSEGVPVITHPPISNPHLPTAETSTIYLPPTEIPTVYRAMTINPTIQAVVDIIDAPEWDEFENSWMVHFKKPTNIPPHIG